MEELEQMLRELGFDEETIREQIDMAGFDVEINDFRRKVQYFKELNLSDRVIRIIIEESILLLTTELNEMQEVIEYLKEKGLEAYIENILEVDPNFICVSLEFIRRNESFLSEFVPKDRIKSLLIERSEIFTYNPDYLENKVEFFIENGLENKIEKLILMHIEAFDLLNSEIDIELLKKTLS